MTTQQFPILRLHILVQGQVQGVGFRPFVYRLATEYTLTGHVNNTAKGVIIEVQGQVTALNQFIKALQEQLPPLAEVTHLGQHEISLKAHEQGFSIIHSQEASTASHQVLISPDVAMCPDCMTDMQSPHNRRHAYPFTNCTNCGPRYTITKSIPYDRATTSMACFALCPLCQEEYDTPLDRRFHAQPNACPTCGPHVWLVENIEQASPTGNGFGTYTQEQALSHLAHALLQGKVAAIKGLGGFHLACDAFNEDAVAQLRLRKNRPHKPLAVMVENLDDARQLATITEEEVQLLCSIQKPIVLCKRNAHLPALLAPDTQSIGLVLPYTPLHVALFMALREARVQRSPAPLALVMTSGNAGGEPICLGNREAAQRLAHMADVFLFHNRDILVRNDDSVCAVHTLNDAPPVSTFLRRARGFVPRPLHLSAQLGIHTSKNGTKLPVVLGMGAELKNTVCLNREHTAFVSQHIGDLQNMETLAFHGEVIKHLEMLLQVQAQCLVHDLHPNFLSTRAAQDMAQERDIPHYALQHHFAHAYAVLAEHAFTQPCLALSLDGTGLGSDGSIWGGELLYIDGLEQQRLGRLSPFALVGGEQAIKEPWRLAVALAQGTEHEARLAQKFPMASAVIEMLQKNIRSPLCSSAGRLFDAVSAGLGLCHCTTYEGQAAIILEEAQKYISHAPQKLYEHACTPMLSVQDTALWELSSHALFEHTLNTALCSDIPTAAFSFHVHLAEGFAHMATLASKKTQVRTICLSGGVMQNASLYRLLQEKLQQRGFTVLSHAQMPCNDGGISLGQCYFGLLQSTL